MSIPSGGHARPSRQIPTPWLVVIGVVVGGGALGFVLSLAGGNAKSSNAGNLNSPGPTTPAASSPSATNSPSPSASSTPSSTPSAQSLAVYYVGTQDDGPPVLFREFHDVTIVDSKPIASALNHMFSTKAADTDYTSPWPSGTKILTSSRVGDTATVNLSSQAGGRTASAALAKVALQQVIYTATAADPSVKKIRVQIDGAPLTSLWGQAVESGALARGPESTYLGPVWIIDPAQGSRLAKTFVVKGSADVFEATVAYQVRKLDGTVVQSGSVTATAGSGVRGTYQRSLTLPTGDYILDFFWVDEGNGARGGGDTKTIHVS